VNAGVDGAGAGEVPREGARVGGGGAGVGVGGVPSKEAHVRVQPYAHIYTW